MKTQMKVAGTWQTATKLQVKVSGVWQTVTKAFVKVSGVWQQVYAAFTPMSGTLTAAQYNGGFNVGYQNGSGGTMSPVTFATGQTVTQFQMAFTVFTVVISGFSGDPGQNGFFTTVTYNGQSRTAATSSYGYSAGVATWTWSSAVTFDIGISRAFSIT